MARKRYRYNNRVISRKNLWKRCGFKNKEDYYEFMIKKFGRHYAKCSAAHPRIKITMEQFNDEMVASSIENNQSQDRYVNY